jgi:hypothetical protein
MLAKARFLVATAWLLCLTVPAPADVPRSMSIQGRLVDSQGDPLTGAVTLTFRIFDAQVGGTEIWPGGAGEAQSLVLGAEGMWQAEVGALAPLTEAVFTADTSRWLEVTVDDGVNPPETLTRLRLSTQPYSFRSASAQQADAALLAADAEQLGGMTAGDFAATDHTHAPAQITPQGSGSDLDADWLDGYDAASFALSTHQHAPAGISPQGDGSTLDADFLDGQDAEDFASAIHAHSPTAITPQGDGSGLDADLLDGQEAAAFAAEGHTHTPAGIVPQGAGSGLDADLLDGQEAADFAGSGHSHGGLWSENGANYFYNGGRVGIGTTSPEKMLHVVSGAMSGAMPDASSIGIFEADNAGYISLLTPDFAESGITFGGPASARGGGVYYNSTLTPGGLQFRTAYNVAGLELESSGRLTVGAITGAGLMRVAGSPVTLTVDLPDSTIDADEIWNEPGVAFITSGVTHTLTSTTMQTLHTVSITIPTAGYIVVEAKCNGLTHGTTGRNQGLVQIDETAGGSAVVPYFASFGLLGYVNGFIANSFPIYVTRIYFKPAGTYTFILEGAQQVNNGVGAVTRVAQTILTATFYPTSYGDATAMVSAGEAAGFQAARPVASGTGETLYEVDLRELEVRAARLSAQAEKAERELLQARRRALEGNRE